MPPEESHRIYQAVLDVGQDVKKATEKVAELHTEVAVLTSEYKHHIKDDDIFRSETCEPMRKRVISLEEAKTRSLGMLDLIKIMIVLIGVLKAFKYMGWIS